MLPNTSADVIDEGDSVKFCTVNGLSKASADATPFGERIKRMLVEPKASRLAIAFGDKFNSSDVFPNA